MFGLRVEAAEKLLGLLVTPGGAEVYEGISKGKRSTPWRGCIWWYCSGTEVGGCVFVFIVATPGLFCSVT